MTSISWTLLALSLCMSLNALELTLKIDGLTATEREKALRGALAKKDLKVLKLGPGRWPVRAPLHITRKHTNLTICSADPKQPATLSGGELLENWKLIEVGNRKLWFSPSAIGSRQLYSLKSDQWISRSRIPNQGWLRGEKLSQIQKDVRRITCNKTVTGWRDTHSLWFAGLNFRPSEEAIFDALAPEQSQLRIQFVGSWESSWHPVRSIDLKSRDLLFYTPSRYPAAHWNYGVNEGGGTPYSIENSEVGIDRDFEWAYSEKRGGFLIQLSENKTPDHFRFIAPRVSTIMKLHQADGITLRHLTFAHSKDEIGTYSLFKDWKNLARRDDPAFPKTFPLGLSAPQGAPGTGNAVLIENSDKVLIERCRFSHLGGYALSLKGGVTDSKISRCSFTQTGSGGITLDPASNNSRSLPIRNEVSDCTFKKGGLIHPAAVAILQTGAWESRIIHNEISDYPYSGISLGWSWNSYPNLNSGTLVSNNHIFNIMNCLSDGAGIYTLGRNYGSHFLANYIHDINRADSAIGSKGSGIFFDQKSRGTLVERNIIRDINSWKPEDNRKHTTISYNQCSREDHHFIENDFDPGNVAIQLIDVAKNAGPRSEAPEKKTR